MRLTLEQAEQLRHQRPWLFAQDTPAAVVKSQADQDSAVAVFDDVVAFTEEETLQNKTYEWLLLNGAVGIVWHNMKKKTTCKRGVSDFVFGWPAKDGRLLFCAAEAKIGKRQPTAAQEAFLSSVRAARGLAFVFRSIAELKANLRGREGEG